MSVCLSVSQIESSLLVGLLVGQSVNKSVLVRLLVVYYYYLFVRAYHHY